jgi:RNA polymerase sigma factor (sigma-70 family)
VDHYTPLLGSVIRRFRLIAAETQDVAQTVWLRLVEHLSGLREPRALPMWIITTGKQESLRCLSDRRRSVPYDPPDPSWPSWPSFQAEDPEPEADLLRADRHEALLAGLAELPARQRELLLLLVADTRAPALRPDHRAHRDPRRQHQAYPPPGPGPAPADLCCQRSHVRRHRK